MVISGNDRLTVWVVHAGRQTVHAYRADGVVAVYGPAADLPGDPMLPGFRVAVADPFRLPGAA